MKFAANLNLKGHQFFFTHPVKCRVMGLIGVSTEVPLSRGLVDEGPSVKMSHMFCSSQAVGYINLINLHKRLLPAY